jgi:hypothetical protein
LSWRRRRRRRRRRRKRKRRRRSRFVFENIKVAWMFKKLLDFQGT